MGNDWREESDAMGTVKVPSKAMYGAQTQRAVNNISISKHRYTRDMISAMGLIKEVAAINNERLSQLDSRRANAIQEAAAELRLGTWDEEIVIDIFHTGSGTSLNMNVNEVIAERGQMIDPSLEPALHPNDDVNKSQSSNDVIPTAIRIAALKKIYHELLIETDALINEINNATERMAGQIKLGRTHLMDAMPVKWSQVWEAWRERVTESKGVMQHAAKQMLLLPLGGTAVGTGVNAPETFGKLCIEEMASRLALPLESTNHPLSKQAGSESMQACAAAMNQMATTLLRLEDDIRCLSSGPIAGFREVILPKLQPGSSIMPDKSNPVVEEAAIQACLQVQSHAHAVSQACLMGSFELHTMQPLIAHNIIEGLDLLVAVTRLIADKSVKTLEPNHEHISMILKDHPILVTALAPIIGYDKATAIASTASREDRSIRAVAVEQTGLSQSEIDDLFKPEHLT